MCDEMDIDQYLLEGEVMMTQQEFQTMLLEEDKVAKLPAPKEHARSGKWDILVIFDIGDEEVLDSCLSLMTAKILVKDCYADLYRKEDCTLVIRRRRSLYVPKPNRITRDDADREIWDGKFTEQDDVIPF